MRRRPPLFQELVFHPQPANVVLETTVGDVTGKAVGAAIAALLDTGAVDAWATAGVGKKGRPALVLVLSVLARSVDADRLVHVLAGYTGTLRIRPSRVDRYALLRRTVEVHVAGCAVRVRIGPYRAKPEHDDVLTQVVVSACPGDPGGPGGGRGVAPRLKVTSARMSGKPSSPSGLAFTLQLRNFLLTF